MKFLIYKTKNEFGYQTTTTNYKKGETIKIGRKNAIVIGIVDYKDSVDWLADRYMKHAMRDAYTAEGFYYIASTITDLVIRQSKLVKK